MTGPNRSRFKGDDLPVENVSFLEVEQFLEKMNARDAGTGLVQDCVERTG